MLAFDAESAAFSQLSVALPPLVHGSPSAVELDGEVLLDAAFQPVRESYGTALADRGWWWLIGLVLLGGGGDGVRAAAGRLGRVRLLVLDSVAIHLHFRSF